MTETAGERLFDDPVNRSVSTVTKLVTCQHTLSYAAPGTCVNLAGGASRSDPSLMPANRKICRSGAAAGSRFCAFPVGLTRLVIRLAQRLPQTDEAEGILVMPVMVNPERRSDSS